MKTTKKIITAVFAILCYSLCEAQMMSFPPSQASYAFKSSIKDIPYIFEAQVVKMRSNGREDSNIGHELICCVVQITKIYKGSPQLKLGTIKVLTTYNRGASDQRPPLKGGKHIIFGRIANSTVFDSIATDNSFTLWAYDYIDFYGTGNHAAIWFNIKFPTLDSLHSFFKNNGLEVQEEVQPTMPGDSVKQK